MPSPAQALAHAAARAVLAPSVHNTQPWRFILGPRSLEIRRDETRQLSVLDPSGRQQTISCGCALYNVRVGLHRFGFASVVDRFPDPADPGLVARVTIDEDGQVPPGPWAELDSAIDDRHTNRRRFADEPVPSEIVDDLVRAAADEGAELVVPIRLEHRLALGSLSREADREQNADPAYRAELRAWTTDDPRRPDGVPASAVPHVDGAAIDDVPIRDFDTHGIGWLPVDTHSSLDQCLLVLTTQADDAPSWVQAGEALEHLWLELTRRGYAASLLTQVIEVSWTRAALREQLALTTYPHILLRVGRAPATEPTRRRPMADVVSER